MTANLTSSLELEFPMNFPKELVESAGFGWFHLLPQLRKVQKIVIIIYHKVIKHVQHGSAHVERPTSPEKEQAALTFLISRA